MIWSSVFGSADSLPILATLGAVYYTLKGRNRFAVLLAGLGFVMKWFPILILPLIIQSFLSKRDLSRFIILSIIPFVFASLLMMVASAVSGITFYGELVLTLQSFSSRFPSGTSVWNLLHAVLSSNLISSTILTFASYSAIGITFLLVGFRGPLQPSFQFILSSAIMLFSVVSIASQIQANYLLWSLPLMLILIMREQILRRVIVNLSLLFAGFLFNFLFTLPRLSTLNPDPAALIARPSVYDALTIAAFQLSAWTLLIMLTKWRSAIILGDR